MIFKAEGIVLRINPFSRTSHVVSWLTPDHGRITALVKGAQRPKSAFLGQYDLFYSCEVVLYFREAGLHIMKECWPIKLREGLRGRWRSAAAASYLCDLVLTAFPHASGHAGAYELLDRGLDFLAARDPSSSVLHWFELQLLKIAGVSPQLTRCMKCHRDLADETTRVRLFPAKGGVLCHACAAPHVEEATAVGPDVLSLCRQWQSSAAPEDAYRLVASARQAREVERILRSLMAHHLEISSRAGVIAGQMLAPTSRVPADGAA